MFKKNLTQLASENITDLDLLSLDNVMKDEISGLKIVLGLSVNISIISNIESEKYSAFIWTVNAEYIRNIIGAIDWFLENNKPGHCYLYEDYIDIELAYKE